VPADLAARLGHVRWLGGGSGAGKSTVAARLAERHGLRVYSTDETLRKHVANAVPDRHPLATAFVRMDMDERWLHHTPAEMVERFHGFHGELFELIVDDLIALRSEGPILAEGFRLLPRLVAPVLRGSDGARRAVWLLPTAAFRRAAFEARGAGWHGAQRTSDPDRAMENLLARDALFTESIGREAADLGLTTIDVDGALTVDSLTDRVAAALGLGVPPGEA
jgi:2-phosphoglycerate kinase